jgi:hypothetical protein
VADPATGLAFLIAVNADPIERELHNGVHVSESPI